MSLFHRRFIACLFSTLFCSVLGITSAQAENRDEVIFFFNDAQGSAVAAVNEAGELCWSEEYTAYGDKGINDDVFSTTGCGIVGEERGFTGHTEDVNSDLVYMQQRYYDPSIGRFLSIDPREANPNEPMTFNRYAYANNNPYKYTDPDGEAAVVLLPAIFEGAAALGTWLFSAKGAAIVTSAGVAGYAANEMVLEPLQNQSQDHDGNYHPAPDVPNGFPDLELAKRKTPVQGGAGLRKRWKDSKGKIYEWDSQHGTVEKYDKNGNHLGEYDAETGDKIKDKKKDRKVEK